MKLKTSITVLIGCLVIFLFIMLPIILSIQDQKDEYVASITGSDFSLKDVNNNPITEKSFQGPASALFFGFTNCPDVCPVTLNKLTLIIDELKKAVGGTDGGRRRRIEQKAKELSITEKYHKGLDKFTREKKLQKFEKDLELSSDELKDLQGSIKENLETYKKYNSTLKNVSASVIGLGKAAYAGEGSISGFTESIRRFGLAGEIIADFGKSLDINIETYRSLAQTGAAFGQSIVQLRQISADAALPLDDFALLVRQNADNLAALYGTTTQGAMAMADLGKGIRDVALPQLAPLGFTVEEINETLLLNLERQRRTFNFDANARQSNIQSAINLSMQLDRLAKLTGVQRDQLQAQIESGMSNERFLAFLGGQTDAVSQRMQSFAATIGSISPDLAEGFQDLIANAGVPVTEAALALVQNMPEAQFAVQNLISGLTTTEGALTSVRDAAVRSQNRFRQATVTGTVEFLRLQKGIVDLGSRSLDVTAMTEEQLKAQDELTKNLTQFQDASKRLSGAFQGLEAGFLSFIGNTLGRGGGLLNTGITGLASSLMALPSGVQAIVYGFGKTIQYGLTALKDTGPTFLAVRQGVIAGMLATGGGRGGGFMGRMGGAKGLAMRGGLAATGGMLALGGIGQAGQAETQGGKALGVLGGAAGGALLGAQLGSFIPGIGTLIGGVAGGVIGGGMALYNANKRAQSGMVHLDRTYARINEGGQPEVLTGNKVLTATQAGQQFEMSAPPVDFTTVEAKLDAVVAQLTKGNSIAEATKIGVNTSVAVLNKTRKVTEEGVRATKSMTGNVLV